MYICTNQLIRYYMKKITLFALIVLILSACNSGTTFTVDGTISDAAGKKLYLEASEVNGVTVLDSVAIRNTGGFKFKQPRPDAPEFYRLRIEDKIVHFAVDSTETVTITASLNELPANYTITGAQNERIKELVIKQMQLQRQVDELLKNAPVTRINAEKVQLQLQELMEAHKQDVKMSYIFAAPNTASAYFALFQRINGFTIFDALSNKEDVKGFAAVATSWSLYYPHALRTKHLTNLALKGMKNTRQPKEQVVEFDEGVIQEASLLDIKLQDIRGKVQTLTALKGKVVLLDFTAYMTQISSTHNYLLRDIYDKYAAKGLEIYQVSLDSDEHYWKTIAGNLPWITVRDPNGIYSNFAALYNVTEVPASFLINRANEVVLRIEKDTDVEAAVKKLL